MWLRVEMAKKFWGSFGVSDELWTKVAVHVPARENTHPCGGGRKPADPRRAFAAIYFVWRTGSQWKALDATGIMAGSTAHGVFQRWVKAGVFERMWRAALNHAAELGKLDWSFVSIDGCMTKAPLGGKKTGPNPTDRGKRGTKLSLATDAGGVPLGVVVDGANRNDHKLLGETLAGLRQHRPTAEPCEHGLCLDKGYDYPESRQLAQAEGYILHLRKRGEDRAEATPGWKPRRWVVERSFSWLHRARRLAIRWEKRASNYLALLHLGCALIALRSLAG